MDNIWIVETVISIERGQERERKSKKHELSEMKIASEQFRYSTNPSKKPDLLKELQETPHN